MTCSGNSTEFCGGPNRLTLYESSSLSSPGVPGIPAGWSDLGCFTDNGGARTLGTQQEVPGGYTNMTIEGCLGVCTNQGYAYGGVEYSQECYCGNAILNGGACADQSSCYMPCKGNTAETCGGPNRLNVYYAGSSQSSCAVRPTSSSTIGTSTSSSTSGPVTSATSSTISSFSLSTSTVSLSSITTLPSSTTSPSGTIPSSSTSTSTSEIVHGPWID